MDVRKNPTLAIRRQHFVVFFVDWLYADLETVGAVPPLPHVHLPQQQTTWLSITHLECNIFRSFAWLARRMQFYIYWVDFNVAPNFLVRLGPDRLLVKIRHTSGLVLEKERKKRLVM